LTAGSDDVGFSESDEARSIHNGGQPRKADFVNRDGRGLPTDACCDGALSRGVLASTSLNYLAKNHLIDGINVHAGAFNCRAEGDSAELYGGE
jgi:hypothetical protein